MRLGDEGDAFPVCPLENVGKHCRGNHGDLHTIPKFILFAVGPAQKVMDEEMKEEEDEKEVEKEVEEDVEVEEEEEEEEKEEAMNGFFFPLFSFSNHWSMQESSHMLTG